MILTTQDFVGKYNLAINQYTESVLENAIEQTQDNILKKLLGYELASLFEADLVNGVPVSQRFLDLFNEQQIDIPCYYLFSKGIKDMLLGFTYFDYVNEQSYRNTMSGAVKTNNDLSTPVIAWNKLTTIYNSSIETYQAIQYFINQNLTVYPEYKGVAKLYYDGF
jgi:hypothetical protein